MTLYISRESSFFSFSYKERGGKPHREKGRVKQFICGAWHMVGRRAAGEAGKVLISDALLSSLQMPAANEGVLWTNLDYCFGFFSLKCIFSSSQEPYLPREP